VFKWNQDFPASSHPLEEDEEALAFLQEFGFGNIERAKLLLVCSLGGGAEYR
jgi:hypothetical protein